MATLLIQAARSSDGFPPLGTLAARHRPAKLSLARKPPMVNRCGAQKPRRLGQGWAYLGQKPSASDYRRTKSHS
jgi:hypothetical protein